MKKFNLRSALFLVLITLLSTSSFIQSSSAQSTLWTITGNGLEAPSYLFGTIHIICEDDYEMTETLEEVIKETDKVVFEIDLDDPSMAAKMGTLMLDPEMRDLSSDLSEEDANTLDAYFKQNFGQGIQQLNKLRPFALLSMIMLKAYECPTKQYETEIMGLAIENKKPIGGLETIEFQMNVIDENFDRKEQLASLLEYVEDPEEVKEMLDKIVASYKEKDIKALYALMEQYEEYDGFNEVMLKNRNLDWMDKLEDQMAKNSLLVAVGAGHLGGEYGVISLLRKAGYTVEPKM